MLLVIQLGAEISTSRNCLNRFTVPDRPTPSPSPSAARLRVLASKCYPPFISAFSSNIRNYYFKDKLTVNDDGMAEQLFSSPHYMERNRPNGRRENREPLLQPIKNRAQYTLFTFCSRSIRTAFTPLFSQPRFSSSCRRSTTRNSESFFPSKVTGVAILLFFLHMRLSRQVPGFSLDLV